MEGKKRNKDKRDDDVCYPTLPNIVSTLVRERNCIMLKQACVEKITRNDSAVVSLSACDEMGFHEML
jgi:hypothetical protein